MIKQLSTYCILLTDQRC